MSAARACLLAALLVAGSGQAATPPTATAQREINGLMEALAHSGCRFQRNGHWHEAGEAQRHLQRKYAYLHKRGLVDSAERFIERAASHSSRSGSAYRVACPGRPEQDAAPWFRQHLAELRGR
ncbi:DUF5329 domain-containing protein [Stenotrophomonas mori]|uniref:DUF5329 domain-containing protein n=1 Tax=Stenotrophomonas mori TaxID=2871096 RepID=A0ABT0SFH7_9GAMM|nr:DUF5329 domain-containing protein [Stenotrophomonas mori]MCL7713818.1 DUF5329 domain-containing protein [Stenotrophomonas mori]